jgi:methylmalonyl-CoA mutase
VIVADEIEELHAYGVARIFSPEDGHALGLEGMIRTILDACSRRATARVADEAASLDDPRSIARLITWLEDRGPGGGTEVEALRARLDALAGEGAPVVGFTGTGGAGKSSVVDEVVRRFRIDRPGRRVALLLVDPTRRRSGGALLGDRIRMNSIHARWPPARLTSRSRRRCAM